ncbi:MAG: hypothetical protein U5K73_05135 [Halofilum sp. (in: g-proteobacteria)]|nr:hypothetical protein [Halofilum sp. (in: g-proteobacteria)]
MSDRFVLIALRVLVVTVVGALAAPTAHAGRTGVDFHFGTLGLGLGLDAQISPHTGFRFGFNRFKTSSDWEEDDLDYEAGIDFDSLHGLLDWHPFGGKFPSSLAASWQRTIASTPRPTWKWVTRLAMGRRHGMAASKPRSNSRSGRPISAPAGTGGSTAAAWR